MSINKEISKENQTLDDLKLEPWVNEYNGLYTDIWKDEEYSSNILNIEITNNPNKLDMLDCVLGFYEENKTGNTNDNKEILNIKKNNNNKVLLKPMKYESKNKTTSNIKHKPSVNFKENNNIYYDDYYYDYDNDE